MKKIKTPQVKEEYLDRLKRSFRYITAAGTLGASLIIAANANIRRIEWPQKADNYIVQEIGDSVLHLDAVTQNEIKSSVARRIERLDNNISVADSVINQGKKTLSDVWQYVYRSSRKYGLEVPFIAAVIKKESDWVYDAVSAKGAKGLMQIMDSTGRLYRNSRVELFDPAVNIEIGANLLYDLLIKYDDRSIALAAYNAGESLIDKLIKKYGPTYADIRNHLPSETRNFVSGVDVSYNNYLSGARGFYIPQSYQTR